MSTRSERTVALIGEAAYNRLRAASVLTVGIGGVGCAAAEALIRSGIGCLTFADGDVFEQSNLNRQIFCTEQTLGKNKAAVAVERARSIDSEINAYCFERFITSDNINDLLDCRRFDFVIDAIDDLQNKIALVKACKKAGIRIVSAMGAGNRTDCNFEATDVFKTKYDPFARKFRKELRTAAPEVASLDVVCASSAPNVTSSGAPASIAAPPIVMGAMLAQFAVNGILAKDD